MVLVTVLELTDEQRASLEELLASQHSFCNEDQMELIESLHMPGSGRRRRGG